ncbi:MAG: entericidin EcnAB [Candidatus Omnitrophica bacterium]|nr:entericidin EcnAB [Candidatus Omnitrophota bacterium]
MKAFLLLIILGIGFTLSVVGCETTRGVGKDVENTGQNVQEVVDDVTDGRK